MASIKVSLVKKYWMALTGLFLCTFLVAHLAGNLQLLMPGEQAKLQFNVYSKFMTSNPLIKILSYVTYLSILFHAILGIVLELQNRRKRPVGYVKNKASVNSIWASRNMGLLGTIVLVFIVVHMGNFWYVVHWGELKTDTAGNLDLHGLVVATFQMGWYVVFYVISMAGIAFHLYHGFQSAFQSLGVNHPKYSPIIKGLGKGFSILIPLLFAIIPIYIFLSHS